MEKIESMGNGGNAKIQELKTTILDFFAENDNRGQISFEELKSYGINANADSTGWKSNLQYQLKKSGLHIRTRINAEKTALKMQLR